MKRTKHAFSHWRPIEYHRVLREEFDIWAECCGTDPHRLRRSSENAIRTRREQAYIANDAARGSGRQPAVYSLKLGTNGLFFTDEPRAIVIRGYWWPVGNPCDDFDGGGFFAESSWRPLSPLIRPEGGDDD